MIDLYVARKFLARHGTGRDEEDFFWRETGRDGTEKTSSRRSLFGTSFGVYLLTQKKTHLYSISFVIECIGISLYTQLNFFSLMKDHDALSQSIHYVQGTRRKCKFGASSTYLLVLNRYGGAHTYLKFDWKLR